MDSHQPADPWGIPEGPTDDADGVVATAPKESPNGHPDHSDDSEVPEFPEPEASTEVPEPTDAVAPAPEAVVTPVEEPVDEEPAGELVVETPEPIAETPSDEPADDGPRFDLGLDEDTSGNWGEPVGQFEAGTAFDLIPPSAEGDEATQQYEVDEPDLSDAFVAASPEGRPDVGTPHLSDPDPLMAVPEETHPDLSEDEPESEPSSSFRLPGLFGRKKIVEETPEDVTVDESTEDTVDEAPADTPVIEAADTSEEPTEEPPMPTAWEAPSTDTADEPANPFARESWAPETEEPADEPTASEDPDEAVASEPAEVGDPFVVEADEDSGETAEQPEDSAEALVEDLENVLELPVAGVTQEEAPEGDNDTMEIELTEPDLSEVIDADQLYVTEDTHEDRPPALLTVDSVPGATIAQAVDVVTAVASAGTETDIADAMDRVLGQLRDKAHEIGGEAVISVHTEVQEMGGGFLVTGSGTAVTLA